MRILIEDRNWEVFVNENATFIKHKRTGDVFLFPEPYKKPEWSNVDSGGSFNFKQTDQDVSSEAMEIFKEGFNKLSE